MPNGSLPLVCGNRPTAYILLRLLRNLNPNSVTDGLLPAEACLLPGSVDLHTVPFRS